MSNTTSVPVPKAKRGLKTFLAETKREMLTKVTWPSVKETNRLTGIVLSVCVLTGLLLAGLSFAAELIVKLITRGSI